MTELETRLDARLGPGAAKPGGSVVAGEALAEDLSGEAGAEVTATVLAAEGGVHFAVVAMLAVAVRVTDVTEVAPDATGI
jgi:hypothetical protein